MLGSSLHPRPPMAMLVGGVSTIGGLALFVGALAAGSVPGPTAFASATLLLVTTAAGLVGGFLVAPRLARLAAPAAMTPAAMTRPDAMRQLPSRMIAAPERVSAEAAGRFGRFAMPEAAPARARRQRSVPSG